MVAVVRRLVVQGTGRAPDRHPAESHRAPTKTRVSDPETIGLGQVGLGDVRLKPHRWVDCP